MHACLRHPYILPRAPSFGLMPNLAVRPSPCVIPVRSHARAPHPFRAPPACSPGLGRAASPPYPARPRLASRLTLAALGRCVAPISATDVRYEHPSIPLDSRARDSRRDDRFLDEHRALAQCHPDRGAGPPFADPTPGEAAFDDALQLRTGRPTSLLLFMSLMRKRRAPRAGRAFLARRSLPRGGSATRPLTLFSRPALPSFGGSREAPGPLPQPSRQRELLSRSKAPSIDKYPPARAGRPSPSLRLCLPTAGSRRSFAPPFACA